MSFDTHEAGWQLTAVILPTIQKASNSFQSRIDVLLLQKCIHDLYTLDFCILLVNITLRTYIPCFENVAILSIYLNSSLYGLSLQ